VFYVKKRKLFKNIFFRMLSREKMALWSCILITITTCFVNKWHRQKRLKVSRFLSIRPIWIRGSRLTNRDYLKDTNNAEYLQPLKNLNFRISQWNQLNFWRPTNHIIALRIIQIVTICQPSALNPYTNLKNIQEIILEFYDRIYFCWWSIKYFGFDQKRSLKISKEKNCIQLCNLILNAASRQLFLVFYS
jgi:Txe/YoeB family toxin of Txe-Axe toxin-antitoxin module